MQYIADRAGKNLAPANGAFERYRVQVAEPSPASCTGAIRRCSNLTTPEDFKPVLRELPAQKIRVR